MTQRETQTHRSGPTPSAKWAGWVGFAAIILIINGMLNMFQGFVALFEEGYFAVASDERLLLVDYTAWGIVMIFWGLALLAAGSGLSSGAGWARFFALFMVGINMILQIGFLSAAPVWGAIVILLDVLVIFALTARWQEARAAM